MSDEKEIIYKDFDPEVFTNTRTAVIDGDGFAYALGWNHKDDLFTDKLKAEVDLTIHGILQGTQSSHYVGILSPKVEIATFYDEETGEPTDVEIEQVPNFRRAIAKSRPYKGNRKEKPEWYDRLREVIEDQLIEKWGFVRTQPGYETDDMVVTMCTVIEAGGGKAICCGNDKDLRQWAGTHFNVRTKLVDEVSKDQADYNLYTQVIIGDTTDNIQGIPGYGPKAAEKILTKTAGQPNKFGLKAFEAYIDAYAPGDKYSPDLDTAIQQFYENYMLVKLRTDLDIQCHEEELIHGYDLELHKDFGKVAPQEEEGFDFGGEQVPDFLKGE